MNIAREVLKRISPYMKAKGFMLSGKNFFYISNDIAYCVALDVPGGLLYTTAYVMPLYMPCETRYYTYGRRLNAQNHAMLPPLKKDADLDSICEWCDAFCRYVDEEVLSFYGQIGSPYALIEYAQNACNSFSNFFSCPPVFFERLKMFTYLYLRDFQKTNKAIDCYRNLLDTSAFLTSSACQKYLDEAAAVQALTCGNEQEISDYLLKTITATRRVL